MRVICFLNNAQIETIGEWPKKSGLGKNSKATKKNVTNYFYYCLALYSVCISEAVNGRL